MCCYKPAKITQSTAYIHTYALSSDLFWSKPEKGCRWCTHFSYWRSWIRQLFISSNKVSVTSTSRELCLLHKWHCLPFMPRETFDKLSICNKPYIQLLQFINVQQEGIISETDSISVSQCISSPPRSPLVISDKEIVSRDGEGKLTN